MTPALSEMTRVNADVPGQRVILTRICENKLVSCRKSVLQCVNVYGITREMHVSAKMLHLNAILSFGGILCYSVLHLFNSFIQVKNKQTLRRATSSHKEVCKRSRICTLIQETLRHRVSSSPTPEAGRMRAASPRGENRHADFIIRTRVFQVSWKCQQNHQECPPPS